MNWLINWITYTHTTVLQLTRYYVRQHGWASTGRNIHPLTPIMVINRPLTASSIYYDPWHPPCSIHAPDNLFPQSFSKFFLVYLLAWHPPLHTPYISSPNHCLLFAAHAHSIATCSAVVPRLCHLIVVSLSTLYLELSCSFKPHIHLTILISAWWSATSFSFLMGHLPCNILLCTQSFAYTITVDIVWAVILHVTVVHTFMSTSYSWAVVYIYILPKSVD